VEPIHASIVCIHQIDLLDDLARFIELTLSLRRALDSRQMNANDVGSVSASLAGDSSRSVASPVVLGLSAVVLVMQLSQAGQKPFGVSRAGVRWPRHSASTWARLNLVAQPAARYGSDRAKGRINYAADGAGSRPAPF